jgi:hypothetical protein
MAENNGDAWHRNGEPDEPATPRPNGWPDPARVGVPVEPERDGWHWLTWTPTNTPFAVQWTPSGQWLPSRYWQQARHEWAARMCHYIGPALLPAEVAAAVAQARREGLEEAAQLVASLRTKAREASYAARYEADADGDHDNRLIADGADFLETAIRARAAEGAR